MCRVALLSQRHHSAGTVRYGQALSQLKLAEKCIAKQREAIVSLEHQLELARWVILVCATHKLQIAQTFTASSLQLVCTWLGSDNVHP
jgi:hypothetical protein